MGRGWKEWTSQRMGGNAGILSLGHGVAVALSNSQQRWRPAKDAHYVINFVIGEERLRRSQHYLEAVSSLGCWRKSCIALVEALINRHPYFMLVHVTLTELVEHKREL